MPEAPRVTVVVPSHRRRLRLRWLLNSFEEQTLPADAFEVVVVHTYGDEDTRALFETDPRPNVRHIRVPPAEGGPAKQRNLGWRAARADLVAFTDDDCRADPRWLEELLRVAEAEPGRIVQGATRNEPLEVLVHAAPHVRSLWVDPPTLYVQTCNVLYPRALLEGCHGFDEHLPSPAGEDTDLAIRSGGEVVAAPEALVYHAVEEYSLRQMIRLNDKWGDVAYVFRRHPQLRSLLTHGVFWRPAHRDVLAAVAGVALARRFPPAALAALPYLRAKLGRRPHRAVAVAELPGQLVVDLAEVGSLVRGSLRHRTLVL